MESRRNYWDEEAQWYAARQWLGNMVSLDDFQHTRRALFSHVRPKRGEQILEVGCGPGLWTSLVAASGAQVLAVDVSKRMIEQARRRVHAESVRFSCCDVLDLELEDESFDKAFSLRAFE